ENLKELENRLANCSRQSEALPNAIRDLQNNVDELLKNSPKIGDAVNKLNSLHDILDSTDDRIEQINSARSGISKAEQRLYSLDSEIKKRFDALKEISEIESNSSDGGESTRVTPAKKDLVRSLKREGWSPAEIAKRVRISESEVALILELPE
ncbi:MAG: hypothetical protein IIW80_06155, partial [Treponema sp.]|nr:hypothetical protein [Treponema sp.]